MHLSLVTLLTLAASTYAASLAPIHSQLFDDIPDCAVSIPLRSLHYNTSGALTDNRLTLSANVPARFPQSAT